MIRMRPGAVTLMIGVALVAWGCSATLHPALGVAVIPGMGEGAAAESAGVRIIARAQAWRGHPADLRGVVTPILVTIQNNSSRPLRVSPASFALAGDGRTYAALPPFEITGSVSEPAGYAAVPWYGFGPPYLPPYHYRPWPYPFRRWPYDHPGWSAFPEVLDPWYYDRYYPVYREVPLPTGDMVQKALPEGVVEPGSSVSGFLYFEDIGRARGGVTFTADITDARTGERVTTIRIPFVAG